MCPINSWLFLSNFSNGVIWYLGLGIQINFPMFLGTWCCFSREGRARLWLMECMLAYLIYLSDME